MRFFTVVFLVFCIIGFIPTYANASERTEAESLHDLKKGAGYLGAAVVCKEYHIAEMANNHLKYLQARDTIAGILRHEDEDFLIQLQKDTSQKVRGDFLSKNPPFACSELEESFERFRQETSSEETRVSLPHSGVNDTYDPLKSNPMLAKALNGLKTRTTSTPASGPSLGWADSIDPAAASITFFLLAYVAWRAFSARKVPPISTFSKALIACLLFLFLRGGVDVFLGVHVNNALNFVMGVFSLVFMVIICSQTKHQMGLLWGGGWMLVRGLINLGIFVWMSSDGLVEHLVTMPLSALPNFIISFILPFIVGGYLIKKYRQKTSV